MYGNKNTEEVMKFIGLEQRSTKEIRVGNVNIGGSSVITVQSMTNSDTRNINATISQIMTLQEAGCDIIRVAVPDMEAAEAVAGIKKAISIPLVADIHFDYRLALKCIESGADKIRINPGNIGDKERVRAVVTAAKNSGVSIRIGVNAGSLEKELLQKFQGATPEAMVESALRHVEILEDLDFSDIIVSLKASNVPLTIQAYRIMANKCQYPLHLGVTEAGTVRGGIIKSSVGIGTLLAEGIGDTIRVSLTGDPIEEIYAGIEILKSLGIRKTGIELISCPTCGRCQVELIKIANEVEQRIKGIQKNLKIAIMGCAVNGPGEAREADIGIAGGKNEVLLFKKGQIIRKISQEFAVEELIREIQQFEG